MTHEWVVKIKRYDGSTSILRRFSVEEAARKEASRLNAEYQTGTHYVEPWLPGAFA